MKAVQERITIHDLWRDLTDYQLITCSYQTLLNWAQALEIDYQFGLDSAARHTLRNYAVMRQKGQKGVRHRINSKAALIAELQRHRSHGIEGRDLITLCEQFGAGSRSTIYRKVKMKTGVPFNSSTRYSVDSAIETLWG